MSYKRTYTDDSFESSNKEISKEEESPSLYILNTDEKPTYVRSINPMKSLLQQLVLFGIFPAKRFSDSPLTTLIMTSTTARRISMKSNTEYMVMNPRCKLAILVVVLHLWELTYASTLYGYIFSLPYVLQPRVDTYWPIRGHNRSKSELGSIRKEPRLPELRWHWHPFYKTSHLDFVARCPHKPQTTNISNSQTTCSK